MESKTLADKYIDPPDSKEIINSILEAKNHGECKDIIFNTFPDWILGSYKCYSTDYSHLTQNWKEICKKIGTVPTEILAVDFISSGDKYKVLQIFCELMTRFGYCVRRKEEYIGCVKCSSAIPSFELWKKMKEHGILVPSEWSKKCSKC